MNKEHINTLNQVDLKLLALRQKGARFGCIMSTQEVFEDANELETSELVCTDKAWSLCGDVSGDMFQALRTGEGIGMGFSVFGEGKQLYFVVTHQVRSMQHRFIMPLYETAVHEFLAHAVRQAVLFSFGNDSNEESVVLWSFEHKRQLNPVLAMAPEWEPEDKVDALSSLLDATHDLSRMEKIPSFFQDYAVSQVSITIIAPMTAGEVDGSIEKEGKELACRY